MHSELNPLVAVFLPIYNSEKTIAKTLQSILNQSYKNIEINISYDESQDKTLEILLSYKDDRIKIYKRNTKPGLFENMNFCINLAQEKNKAKYVTLYNGDDLYSEKIIEEQVRFMELNTESPAVFTEGIFIDQNDRFIGFSKNSVSINSGSELFTYENLFFGALRSNVTCLSPSFMVRQKILNEDHSLRQRPDLHGQAADFGFFLTIAKLYGPVGIIRKPLLKYRIWSGNSSAVIYDSLPDNMMLINFFINDPLLKRKISWIDRAYIGKLNLALNNALMLNYLNKNEYEKFDAFNKKYSYATYLISMISLAGLFNIYKLFLIRFFVSLKLNKSFNKYLILLATPNRIIRITRILRNFNSYKNLIKK